MEDYSETHSLIVYTHTLSFSLIINIRNTHTQNLSYSLTINTTRKHTHLINLKCLGKLYICIYVGCLIGMEAIHPYQSLLIVYYTHTHTESITHSKSLLEYTHSLIITRIYTFPNHYSNTHISLIILEYTFFIRKQFVKVCIYIYMCWLNFEKWKKEKLEKRKKTLKGM